MGELIASRYELVDQIGYGSTGVVWRVWDYRDRRYLAAKVTRHGAAFDLLSFVREYSGRITHPHVLLPHRWVADGDKIMFLMDLVDGGTLAHLVADHGPLPPPWVCVLLDQLLAGLEVVHETGAVHRGIDPAAVLLKATDRDEPHLRLAGFGLARSRGERRLLEARYTAFSAAFTAPEQTRGEEPDHPADLFSVGAMALYLLQGNEPGQVFTLPNLRSAGNPPDGVPELLWPVIGSLIHQEPLRRPTATAARHGLIDALTCLDPSFLDDPPGVPSRLGPLPAGFGPSGPRPEHRARRSTARGRTPPAAGRAGRTAEATRPPKPPEPVPLPPDLTAADAENAAETLEHTLARLFVRLGSPPEPTELDCTPAGTGDGGAQQ
ncbi:serine/threonine-protein kinase [Streptomyces sp. NPDC003691]